MIKMELKNLTKSYEKGKIALDHFSAALEPGGGRPGIFMSPAGPAAA